MNTKKTFTVLIILLSILFKTNLFAQTGTVTGNYH